MGTFVWRHQVREKFQINRADIPPNVQHAALFERNTDYMGGADLSISAGGSGGDVFTADGTNRICRYEGQLM
jgi:hypothetical protein